MGVRATEAERRWSSEASLHGCHCVRAGGAGGDQTGPETASDEREAEE